MRSRTAAVATLAALVILSATDHRERAKQFSHQQPLPPETNQGPILRGRISNLVDAVSKNRVVIVTEAHSDVKDYAGIFLQLEELHKAGLRTICLELDSKLTPSIREYQQLTVKFNKEYDTLDEQEKEQMAKRLMELKDALDRMAIRFYDPSKSGLLDAIITKAAMLGIEVNAIAPSAKEELKEAQRRGMTYDDFITDPGGIAWKTDIMAKRIRLHLNRLEREGERESGKIMALLGLLHSERLRERFRMEGVSATSL